MIHSFLLFVYVDDGDLSTLSIELFFIFLQRNER